MHSVNGYKVYEADVFGKLEPVINFPAGGAGSQFFSVRGARSDAYRVSASDERQRNEENWPQPFGLRRKSGHTSLSASTVDPPQPSASASSGPIFARNAAARKLITGSRVGTACFINGFVALAAIAQGAKAPHFMATFRQGWKSCPDT